MNGWNGWYSDIRVKYDFKHFLRDKGYGLSGEECDWESILIALENDPIFHTDYEEAFKNWLDSTLKYSPNVVVKIK